MQALEYNFDKRIAQRIIWLRKQKHDAGFPFMIESNGELPANQAYMEYPDGRVEVVEFDSKFQDYVSVKTLNEKELSWFHLKYKLH